MKKHYFVLTQNVFLYQGIRTLLQDHHCHHVGFDEPDIPGGKEITGSVTLVVDTTLFYAGQWMTWNTLLTYFLHIDVIWLTREETGRVFPAGREGDVLLGYRDDVDKINAILNDDRSVRERITPLKLTRRESVLFPVFMSGMDIDTISAVTGTSTKTLYLQRLKIMEKAGFRSICFMQFIYRRNALLWHP